MTAVIPSTVAVSLRRLYFTRFAFALIWAGLLAATASSLTPISIALLVLYPLFDGVAAVVDARSSKDKGPTLSLYANIAISWLTAAGLAVATSSGIPAVLRVWGAWAIVSGVTQLAVGVIRRHLDGHWPMILSGGISVVAGSSFILQAGQEGASLLNLAGYATLGGLFFLASALRLGRATRGR
ncbi:hypothetical protein [Herbidospora sp. NBRC 101105]|uniref:hypothetical protein n=1 Tax=Herbidospora sp. NBRC 101105 TaxID=3032195 RepID=UPI0024A58F8F|nr:hypothetical protein [Herbidospora sp. NBRC 101105]GLX95897.1 membrane protein [Herbidospora sp. NBRC 101105]